MAYGQSDSVLGLFPGKEGHLRVRREHGRFLRYRKRMGVGIVRHHEDRCCAAAHELTRHAENEVGVAVQLVDFRLRTGIFAIPSITQNGSTVSFIKQRRNSTRIRGAFVVG